jgi:HAD superfamily hydrolase (TIGR01509 family)
VIKPNLAILRLLCTGAKLASEACLFVDDAPGNVEGACAVGMAGHHFAGAEALRVDPSLRGLL